MDDRYKEYPLHADDYDLRHSLVYEADMERFYVARAPLKLPVEVNVCSKHKQKM